MRVRVARSKDRRFIQQIGTLTKQILHAQLCSTYAKLIVNLIMVKEQGWGRLEFFNH